MCGDYILSVSSKLLAQLENEVFNFDLITLTTVQYFRHCTMHMRITVGWVKFSEWQNWQYTGCGSCKMCGKPETNHFYLFKVNCFANFLQQ